MSFQKAKREKEAPGEKLITSLSTSFDGFHGFTLLNLTPCILPVFPLLRSTQDRAAWPYKAMYGAA